jgi:uncharacterized protein
MKTNIKIPKGEISDFCKRNHIRRLAFFGSIQRNDFKPGSDVDVLVEFEPGRTPGFFKLFDMEEELSVILEGRKVDLRTPGDLSRYFREKIKKEAEAYYVQG